jgi:hypothetical protein
MTHHNNVVRVVVAIQEMHQWKTSDKLTSEVESSSGWYDDRTMCNTRVIVLM